MKQEENLDCGSSLHFLSKMGSGELENSAISVLSILFTSEDTTPVLNRSSRHVPHPPLAIISEVLLLKEPPGSNKVVFQVNNPISEDSYRKWTWEYIWERKEIYQIGRN